MKSVPLAKIVGSPFCVASEDGAKVHAEIIEALDRNERVELSFLGVRRLTTAFLNSAVGQLYNEYDESKLRRLMSPKDASQGQLEKLKKSVDNAKRFFKDPNRVRSILNEVLGE